jgi:hypothetical protein
MPMNIQHIARAACVAALSLAGYRTRTRTITRRRRGLHRLAQGRRQGEESGHGGVRAQGMGVAPAGIKFDNTGHHHLLIDNDVPADLSLPLAANEKSVHFGKGQTETSLTLPPGKHTLQLVLGDSLHIPHDPAVISKKITITVEK